MPQDPSSGFDLSSLSDLLGSMEALKAQAATITADGQAGGGLVKATANGDQELVRIQIDPRAMDDRELLEDLVTVAINDALRKSKELMASQMADMTGFAMPSFGG